MKRRFIICRLSTWTAATVQAAGSAQPEPAKQSFHIQQPGYDVTVIMESGYAKVEQEALNALVHDTAEATNPQGSLLTELSRGGTHELPSWLYEGIAKCEAWFQLTEGKVSCRNGALYRYWEQYVAGNESLERRDARKLARASRVTAVSLTAPAQLTMPQAMPDGPFWNVGIIGDALMVNRISGYLAERAGAGAAFSVQVNDTVSFYGTSPEERMLFGEPVADHTGPFSGSVINTVMRKVVAGAKEAGVLDSSDGWPSSGLTSHVVAKNVFDAALAAQLAVITTTTQMQDLLSDKLDVLVKTTDKKGRVNTSDGYFAFWRGKDDAGVTALDIDVTLPRFNVSNYHGPYASVWLTGEDAQLVKSLLIRGDSQRWLTELRVWWRKIGRTHEDFIDGFAGATRKNKPLHVHWDGFDEQGRPVTDKKLVLNVEVAREDGGRNYQKIPLDLNALIKQPLHTAGKGEIGDITVSL